MKKPIIEMRSEHTVVCDNPTCDHTEGDGMTLDIKDLEPYLNKPCPKCGENLLT